MHIFDLILHFSASEEVPIEATEVKTFILSSGMDLVVRFIGVQLDTEVTRGYLSQYTKLAPPYGEDQKIADIYYATNQDSGWTRLVSIKELTHILDTEPMLTSTREDVDTLVKRMALAPEFQNIESEMGEGGPKVMVDRIAVVYALAIAFPWATRELLMPRIADGTLNEDDVVRLVDLPLQHVRLVLSETWPLVYSALTPERHSSKSDPTLP